MSNRTGGRAPVDPEARRNVIILMTITSIVAIAVVVGTILFLN
jgi:hypothetical protein